MSHTLEDRRHYALPLTHVDFDNIRCNVCICNGETVDKYRHSQDGLMIQVKCYDGQEIDSMSDLDIIDNTLANWTEPALEEE